MLRAGLILLLCLLATGCKASASGATGRPASGKFLLAGRPIYLYEHKEAVTHLLRALLKAEQFGYSHPEEARAMIAAPLNVAPDLLHHRREPGDCP